MKPDTHHAFLCRWDHEEPGSGPLAGRRVAVKDNICVRGVPCTCGSRILENWIPPYDATVVERLRGAGAVIVGKTNMDEFGMGSSTEHSAFGPTRNPYSPDLVAGGSSGGSCVAVAQGLADLGFGSDTGGSVRQPASFCGVVGLKPTYGLVSRYGLVAYASSLDTIGTIARSVAEVAAALAVIAGHDPRDSTSTNHSDQPDLSSVLHRGARDVRVGVLRNLLDDSVAPEIRGAVTRVANGLSDDGARVEETSVPELGWALSAYYLIATAEASSNLARYDGVRYGLRVEADTADKMFAATRAAGFGPEVKRRIVLGTYALSAGHYDDYYGKSQRVRTLLIGALARAYEQFDVLLLPTSPVMPFGLGERIDDPLSMYLADTCTVPANLAGTPAISVPAGLSSDGLPVGVQLMASHFQEHVLIRVAAAIEARSPRSAPTNARDGHAK